MNKTDAMQFKFTTILAATDRRERTSLSFVLTGDKPVVPSKLQLCN